MTRKYQLLSQRHCLSGGFSLVEVLVALLVLSIGLLGLAALQTTSLKYNTESYTRTQATFLAYDIIDRMRANSVGFIAGNYEVTSSAAAAAAMAGTAACGTGNCSTAGLAAYDLGQWYTRMQTLLPGSTDPVGNFATIAKTAPGSSSVTITINWIERDIKQTQTWNVLLPTS